MLSKNIVAHTLEYFATNSHRDFVVKPSLPILYFGNLDEYRSSSLKVITVGKNPSDNEFCMKKGDAYSFYRFKKWKPDEGNLIESLNPYFQDEPLSWFSCYEPVLKGIGCSYYPGRTKNRALHTDICSPIATKPTWSKLTQSQQALLYREGNGLWKQLIDELQPDILLISVPQQLFSSNFHAVGKDLIAFDSRSDGSKRNERYRVVEQIWTLDSGKTVKVVFGQAAQTPFGTISSAQKIEVGKSCLR